MAKKKVKKQGFLFLWLNLITVSNSFPIWHHRFYRWMLHQCFYPILALITPIGYELKISRTNNILVEWNPLRLMFTAGNQRVVQQQQTHISHLPLHSPSPPPSHIPPSLSLPLTIARSYVSPRGTRSSISLLLKKCSFIYRSAKEESADHMYSVHCWVTEKSKLKLFPMKN